MAAGADVATIVIEVFANGASIPVDSVTFQVDDGPTGTFLVVARTGDSATNADFGLALRALGAALTTKMTGGGFPRSAVTTKPPVVVGGGVVAAKAARKIAAAKVKKVK